jgi:ADP-ribosylglycohydrolase
MASLPVDHAARMDRVRLALDGLSVGDAFGGQFFIPEVAESAFPVRGLPPPPWRYTDDTEMALGISEVLERQGRIDQDELARVFARRYHNDAYRGYGPTMHDILPAIGRGVPWREAAATPFGGRGSLGNGSAMRVAPVGAYFADDLDAVVAAARASAEVTHAHPEGRAGAIAIAVAAAWAFQAAGTQDRHSGERLFQVVLDRTPEGRTRQGILSARELGKAAEPGRAASHLGNGSRVTCMDTVPFCLWCAARHLDSYPEALWTTVSGFGDVDTTCAIVGGIVALATGRGGIPGEWLEAREPLGFLGDRERR